jgi:triosephosphate isomerase
VNTIVRLDLGGAAQIIFEAGDITEQKTDAIVNAANSSLMGGGGVDGAIHRAGGPAILEECRRIVARDGHLPPGEAVETTAGELQASYVIHTVGPIYRDGLHGESSILASAYRNSLRLADRLGLLSVAFPAISTGVYGFPAEGAAEVALGTVIDELTMARNVRLVRFVLFSPAMLSTFIQAAIEQQRRRDATGWNFTTTTQEEFNPRKEKEAMMSRKKIIAANWKMYKTPDQARQFMHEFAPLVKDHKRDEIVVCPPFIDIATVAELANGSNIEVGAQNLYWEKEGAFTAEISGEMLVGAGCKWVIIGHSERRQYFGETDDTVNHRLKVALEAGLAPIVCVGEVKEERESGITEDVLRRQCTRAFAGVSARKAARMVVAYEPVWAIGTGLTATPEMASDAHQLIRREAANVFGEEYAQQLRILYGGSVKPENAHALLSQPEIDGALVGGASLKADSFSKIVHW